MSRILGFGCSSAAGPTSTDFWKSLSQGVDHTASMTTPVSSVSVQTLLVSKLSQAWHELMSAMSEAQKASLPQDDRLGVIFASTKGCIDDFIWDDSSEDSALHSMDPFTAVMNEFLERAGIKTSNTLCVSNACASSLSALHLGMSWIEKKRVTHVLVLAADHVGKFVLQGFQSLQALSSTKVRPFAKNRDGLRLGAAAAAILLTDQKPAQHLTSDLHTALYLEAVGLDTEGYAVTRPSHSGASLKRACDQVLARVNDPASPPDLLIAHGTATQINDVAEDQVFSSLFPGERIPVTGTKWCIGHTLATSGAMDLIAACWALREQSAFCIANTFEVDPTFKGNYLVAGSSFKKRAPNMKRVMVTSLGFGGVHAAAMIRLGQRVGDE